MDDMNKGWIAVEDPYSELPQEPQLWVTRKLTLKGRDYYEVDTVGYDMTEWDDNIDNVIAYKYYETPEPYNPTIERSKVDNAIKELEWLLGNTDNIDLENRTYECIQILKRCIGDKGHE